MFEIAMAAVLGFLFITIIDRIWFRIDYKKVEKGLEVMEHYHYGLLLFALAPFFIEYSLVTSFGLLGMGTAFIYHESKQRNFFAHQSVHFKGSTIIGVTLAIIAIVLYFYLVVV